MGGEIVRVAKGFDKEGSSRETGDRFVGQNGRDLWEFDNPGKEDDCDTEGKGKRGLEALAIG